jgi:plastocyanin
MRQRDALRLLVLPVALVLALGILAACNGDDDDDFPPPPTPVPDEPVPPENDNDVQVFDVTMGDNMFDPDEFRVAPGEELRFNLSNLGINAHNMRIAGEDNEFDTEDDVVSEPDILRSGEEGVLEWTAPEDPRAYVFRCDFHPEDMIGTIIVE